MEKELSNVGRYLYALRINSGYQSISDYLKRYKLPISDNYYRDVESGRKRLSLEKAIELTESLPLGPDGQEEFIWHFLRDVLPPALEKKLLLPRVDKSFATAKEALDLLQRDLQIYRNADAIKQFEENFISSEDVYELLADNIDLLPILHFIYMTEVADEEQLMAICKAEHVSYDLDRIKQVMGRCGVTIDHDHNKLTFRRAKSVFRVTNTTAGRRLKRQFADVELEKSREKPHSSQLFDKTNTTFESSVIVSASTQRAAILTERLQDFLAETTLAKDQLGKTDAQAYFVMCVVSTRPEYNPKSLG